MLALNLFVFNLSKLIIKSLTLSWSLSPISSTSNVHFIMSHNEIEISSKVESSISVITILLKVSHIILRVSGQTKLYSRILLIDSMKELRFLYRERSQKIVASSIVKFLCLNMYKQLIPYIISSTSSVG